MEERTIQYRYLDGDGEGDVVTEQYTVELHHDHSVVVLDGPAGAVSGKPLDEYLAEPDYLPSLQDHDRPGHELRRRLPELDAIEDWEDAFETLEVLYEECPATYWTKPASGSGKYHPPDERGVHGQWIHTKRMLRTYQWFAANAEEMAELDDPVYGMDADEVQDGLIAAALHDIYKFGEDGQQDTAVPDHDEMAAAYVREETSFDDAVADAIEAHNGPYGDGKRPEDAMTSFVHLADYTVANTASEDLLWKPAEELRFARVVEKLLREDEALAGYTAVFADEG